MAIRRETLRILRRLMVGVGGTVDDETRALTRAWTRAWDELAATWRGAMDELLASTVQTGQWPTTRELQRLERLGRALAQTEQALAQLGKRAGVTIADGAGQIVQATADVEPRLIASQLPAAEQASAVARFAGQILPSALDVITARTQSHIASTLWPLTNDALEAMRRTLVQGTALGSNPRAVASNMVGRVQGAFEGGLTRAVNIARTEMLDAYRATSQYAHAANGDVVAGWVWHAQGDKRTCPSCWAMHGKEFPLTLPGPWDHQQGRCARLPKTKSWRELGFDIDEPADDIPDLRARFDGLPVATQQKIMGPGRLQLLRAGKVSWDDMPMERPSPAWRTSYGPRSVRDLERISRARTAGVDVNPGGTPAPGSNAAKRAAARVRNKDIEAASQVADFSAELDYVTYARRGMPFGDETDRILRQRVAVATHSGVPDQITARVVAAIDTRDLSQVRSVGQQIATDRGLRPIGAAGRTVKYAEARHTPQSGFDPTPGQPVRIYRQGHTYRADGDTVLINRAIVQPAPAKAPAPVRRPPKTMPSKGAPKLGDIIDPYQQRVAGALPKIPKKAFAQWIDGQYAGLQVTVTRVVNHGTTLGIEVGGVIKDATGRRVGRFERVFNRDSDGKLYAYHAYLKIQRRVQGSGFQAEFNANLIDWYRRSGVDHIRVGANIDIGGYTWAATGYDFREEVDALNLFSRLNNRLGEILGQPLRALDYLGPGSTTPAWTWTGRVVLPAKPAWTQAKLRKMFRGASDEEIGRQIRLGQEFIARLRGKTFNADDFPSAHELSQLGRWKGAGKDDVWIGKLVMLGSNWRGILRL